MTPEVPDRKRRSRRDSISVVKNRKTQPLGALDKKLFYHTFNADDVQYFDGIVEKLRVAAHLNEPHALEPRMASAAGLDLVPSSRLDGLGMATDDESVYATLVFRPPGGPFICLLCGGERPDRKLNRALDHIRAHFKHKPWVCRMEHPVPPVPPVPPSSSSAPHPGPW